MLDNNPYGFLKKYINKMRQNTLQITYYKTLT